MTPTNPAYDEGHAQYGLPVQPHGTYEKAEVNDVPSFLRKFRPNGPWVLSSIVPDGRITTTSFRKDQESHMRDWVASRLDYENLYFQVNRSECLTKKATKNDITAAEWLHVDVDPEAGEDFEEQRQKILGRLQSYSPKPTLIIDSGGGYQAFWRLSEPVECDWSEFERYNRQLVADLNADNCHNVDRIMRLPFTQNIPNKKKRKAGRKIAVTKIVHMNDLKHDLESFSKAPQLIETEKPAPVVVAAKTITAEVLDTLPDRVVSVAIHMTNPDGEPYTDRSEGVFYLCCEAVRTGVSEDVILGLLLDTDLKVSEHIYEKCGKRGAEKYARRQIERARLRTADYTTNKNGQPIASLRNLRIALERRNLPLWWDEYADQMWLGKKQVTDNIERDLRFKLEEEEKLVFSVTGFREAVSQIAYENKRHPLQEHLESLEWDGTPRIDTFFIDWAEADDTEYVRTVSRLWFLAGAKRALEPGCKFDELVILESPQGGYKSSAMERLAFGSKWFTDALPLDGNSKIAIEQTRGKWICEVADMQGRAKDDNKLKAFLSRTHDRARLAYDRRTTDAPRSWIPIGTTNDDRYLTDATGNRRFWPIRIGTFNLGFDPEQLWAEAVAHPTESIRMPTRLWQQASEQQREREEDDPWAEMLGGFFGDKALRVPCNSIYPALGIPLERQKDKYHEVSKTMRRLGFERKKNQWINKKNCNAWVRGENPQDFIPPPNEAYSMGSIYNGPNPLDGVI